eukprot:7346836-Alexandrium_andersonii.AAC.1
MGGRTVPSTVAPRAGRGGREGREEEPKDPQAHLPLRAKPKWANTGPGQGGPHSRSRSLRG